MTVMQPYKTIIIDDEEPARLRLRNLAVHFSEFLEIVGEARNGEEAVEMIDSSQPDLIFLDIRMPGMDGFEVLKKIRNMPLVVFCTAYDEYALRAFDAFCADYLLKPVTKERIQSTVNKLKQFGNHHPGLNISDLIDQLAATQKNVEVTSIPVKSSDKVIFIRLEDVSYLKADEKYVTLVTKHAKSHLLDSSLKKLEEKLPHDFVRVHKSFIINKKLLKEVRKHFNNRFVLVMDDFEQTRIVSGRSYGQMVRELFEL